MAWVATEDFNGYSDGDLNTLNGGSGWSSGWTANASVDVQGSVVYEGAKAGFFNSVADGVGAVRSLTTAVSSGTVSLRVRRPDKSAIFDVRITDASDQRLIYLRFGTADITLINNSETIVSGYSIDTWYLVELFIDTAGSGAHKVRIDGGSWTSTVNDYDGGAGDAKKILLESGGAGCNAYFDDIKPASEVQNLTLTAETGSYILTGIDVGLGRLITIVASVGSFVLTGIDNIIRFSGWTNQSKNSSIFTNQTKSVLTEDVELLYDSYSESNANIFLTVPTSGSVTAYGQSFVGDGGRLTEVKFYLDKSGTLTGNITAYLYAHSGTYGTSSVPTGSILATSSPVAASTITSTPTLHTFTFDGTYELIADTNYVVVIEYTEGDYFGGDFLMVGSDQSSSSHSGNASIYSGSWSALATTDLGFYVYALSPVEVSFTNQTKNSSSWTNQTKQ